MSTINNSTNKVVSGLLWVYLENIAAQLVSFVVTIVLARLLEPTYYGTIALVCVFVNLASVFVSSGISSALIQKKDADELDYSSMFWFNLLVAIALYFVLFFAAPLIGYYYSNNDLILILRVISLSIPLSAINCIQQAFVTQKMIFRKSFVSNSGGSIISGIFGIVLAYLGFGVWSLVAQRLLSVAITTLILWFIVDWRPGFLFSMKRVRPLFSFGWKMMVTGFLFSAYTEIRSLIIGKRYSSEELGYYDRGFSFPRLIAGNIDGTITRVLFPALAEKQDDKFDLANKTRRAAKTSAYIMTPILFGMAIVANPLVLLLLGEKWLPCVPFLQIMCLVWWLQPTQTCASQAIKAIGRSDLYLYMEFISKGFGLTLLFASVYLFDSVIAIALSMLAGQVVALIVYGLFTSKYVGYRFRYQLLDLFVPSFFSGIMCVCAYFISMFIDNSLICIIVQVLSGFVVYVGISHFSNNDSYCYIKGILAKQFKHN